MKIYDLLLAILLLLGTGGCFDNREAPYRPVTANSLEEAVAAREQVEKVVLADAKLEGFPRELAALPRLTVLHLRGTRGLQPLHGLGKLRGLEELDLGATALDALPLELTTLDNLKTLYLCHNSISNLPAQIGALRNLTYLNLDGNALAELPPEIGSLTALHWLRLNDNRLKDLPDMTSLVRLKRIYLRRNQLSAVPEALKGLPLLEDLSLRHNPLKALPDWITELPALRQLDLDHCPLTHLPEDLSALRQLQVLSLTNCKLPAEEQRRIREALPKAHIAF